MHSILPARKMTENDILIDGDGGALWHYWLSGLDNIFVRGGIEWLNGYFRLTALDKIHNNIVEVLVNQSRLLSGNEFRFLRKELIWTAHDIAVRHGVSQSDVHTWEESSAVPLDADKFLRSQFACFALAKAA